MTIEAQTAGLIDEADRLIRERLGRLTEDEGRNRRLLLDAWSIAEEAIRQFGDSSTLHNDLGVIQFHLADRARAALSFRKSLSCDPTNIDARKNLALCFIDMGEAGGAIAQYYEVLEAVPADIESLIGLGSLFAATKRHKLAVSYLGMALKHDPENVDARRLLGDIHEQDERVLRLCADSRETFDDEMVANVRRPGEVNRDDHVEPFCRVRGVEPGDGDAFGPSTPFSPVLIRSMTEYDAHLLASSRLHACRREWEEHLAAHRRPFTLTGTCFICRKPARFHVDDQYAFPDGRPNWRERMICSGCGLSNRLRASIHCFEHVLGAKRDWRVYVTEQRTPLYGWLRRSYPRVIGSEFLGAGIPRGTTTIDGTRNEDLTALTFASESVDAVLSFEVFEHIPHFRAALGECARVLVPGGVMLFSVPFVSTNPDHTVRARLCADGTVEHLLEPEYHGDPLNTRGCLAFYNFGWELMDDLRTAGFREAGALALWSEAFGYVGGEQLLFTARK